MCTFDVATFGEENGNLPSDERPLTLEEQMANNISCNKHDVVLSDKIFLFGNEKLPLGVKKEEVKYLIADTDPTNLTGVKINPEIENRIPDNKRGIYIFVVRPKSFLDICYPAYIGRAQHFDTSYDLKTRIKCYERDYRKNKNNRRKRLDKLFKECRNHLFLQAYIFPDNIPDANQRVKDVEADLIKSVLPIFNKEISDVTIRNACIICNFRI